MPRLLLIPLLLSAPAAAAPVPKQVLSAEQEKEFNDLWDATGYWYSTRARLYCRLASQPYSAVAYLRKQFPPAELSEKDAYALLERLGSEQDKVWKQAYRDLCVRDVRLALSVKDAWAEAKTDRQRFRLGALLYGHPSVSDIPPSAVRYGIERRGEWYAVGERRESPNQHVSNQVHAEYPAWAKHQRTYDGPVHTRAVVAVAVLERTATSDAVSHLKALAKGQSDASATVESAATLERMRRQAVPAEKPLPDHWKLAPKALTSPPILNEFLRRPKEAVGLLKGELKPLTLSKKDAKGLLARLLGDDSKQCRAALRELRTFDLRLALNAEEVWDEAKTPTQRGRLVTALSHWQRLPELVIGDDFDVDKPHQHFDYVYAESAEYAGAWVCQAVRRDGVRDTDLTADERDWLRETPGLARTLSELGYERWPREESAIYILDAIGTDDAIAVIKEMATGHPDAGPTKAAKEVLKRRGVK